MWIKWHNIYYCIKSRWSYPMKSTNEKGTRILLRFKKNHNMALKSYLFIYFLIRFSAGSHSLQHWAAGSDLGRSFLNTFCVNIYIYLRVQNTGGENFLRCGGFQFFLTFHMKFSLRQNFTPPPHIHSRQILKSLNYNMF